MPRPRPVELLRDLACGNFFSRLYLPTVVSPSFFSSFLLLYPAFFLSFPVTLFSTPYLPLLYYPFSLYCFFTALLFSLLILHYTFYTISLHSTRFFIRISLFTPLVYPHFTFSFPRSFYFPPLYSLLHSSNIP
jgi:hypothetical protein